MRPPNAAGPDERPLVGVVVPAYNTEAYIGETLRSVSEQTWPRWECVVVDDGSPDGLAAVVEEWSRRDPRIRIVRQDNQGLSAARNAGLAQLSGDADYVAFLDSDDVWCPRTLEILLDRLGEDPQAVGSFGYAELLDQAGEPLLPGFHPARQRDRHAMTGWVKTAVAEAEPVRFAEIVIDNPIWPPAVALHRRWAVEVAGGFDPELPQLEDVDFLTRMCRVGHYVNARAQVAWYRQHPGQMTKRRAEFWWSHDTLRHKTWESSVNTAGQRRTVERAWRVAQGRRLSRCTIRLVSSVAERDWPRSRQLFRGWRVLAGQLVHGTPPEADLDHVVWTGRDV